MKILHITKTSEASFWAVRQAAYLVKQGIDVHAVLPKVNGRAAEEWNTTGATIHFLDCSLPTSPVAIVQRGSQIRRLVESVKPDLIHTHHVTTTIMVRLALGRHHVLPRVFQVPGPLHLEHWHTRNCEISLAGKNDFWIAGSRFIMELYEKAGIAANKLFLSYYSADTKSFSGVRSKYLRIRLGIPERALVVGNINLIYPPKRYLGQTIGLKCHEDVIEAIRLVQQKRDDVWGVLVGGTFGDSAAYERKLKMLAAQKGNGRIMMPGKFSSQEVAWSWPDFDCAVHVPLSENCGGAIEPLLSGVPTIAGDIGALPELVWPGLTGTLVRKRNPGALADAVLDVLDRLDEFRRMAQRGMRLASVMFDADRCSKEVLIIYRHLLSHGLRPEPFDAKAFLLTSSLEAGRSVVVSQLPTANAAHSREV